MKLYIVKQENYEELAYSFGASVNLGIYTNKETALNVMIENIYKDINENYIVDKESDIEKYKKDFLGSIRLFYNYQNNYDYRREYSVEFWDVELSITSDIENNDN
jgi:hypothetical protein